MTSRYKIGYKNPPLHTRFKKGESGNPAGRPKYAKNLKTDLLEELRETLVVREGSRPRRVSKQRALIKSLIAKGIKGDSAAAARLLELCIRVFGVDDENSAEPVQALSKDEREVLADAEARLTQLFGLSLPRDRDRRNPRN
jgi:hypothetical protein